MKVSKLSLTALKSLGFAIPVGTTAAISSTVAQRPYAGLGEDFGVDYIGSEGMVTYKKDLRQGDHIHNEFGVNGTLGDLQVHCPKPDDVDNKICTASGKAHEVFIMESH